MHGCRPRNALISVLFNIPYHQAKYFFKFWWGKMRELLEGIMSLKERKMNYWENLGSAGIENQRESEYLGSVLCSVPTIKQFVNYANIITNCHTVETVASFRLVDKSLKKVRKMKFHVFCSSLCLRTSPGCWEIPFAGKLTAVATSLELSSHHTMMHSQCQRWGKLWKKHHLPTCRFSFLPHKEQNNRRVYDSRREGRIIVKILLTEF